MAPAISPSIDHFGRFSAYKYLCMEIHQDEVGRMPTMRNSYFDSSGSLYAGDDVQFAGMLPLVHWLFGMKDSWCSSK